METAFSDVKKVRKRKMRSFKLGLSRPKSKKKTNCNEVENESELSVDVNESDEINESRDSINSISDLHFKRTVKMEPKSILEHCDDVCDSNDKVVKEESILELVNKITVKPEITVCKQAETYDILNKYVPEAGTSTTNFNNNAEINKLNESLNLSYESSPDDNKLGIMSFYNTSKFNMSLDKSLEDVNFNNDMSNDKNNSQCDANDMVLYEEDIKTIPTHSIILTPKIRPPSKEYIVSSLEQYNIPKLRNPEAYYSDPTDVGDKVEIGQIILKLRSKSSRDQKAFDKVLDTTSIEEWRQLLFLQTNEMSEECSKPDDLKKLLSGNREYVLEPIKRPPTTSHVKRYIEQATNIRIDTSNEDRNEISTNIDELENSQAIGLNDEIDSSISLGCEEKVH